MTPKPTPKSPSPSFASGFVDPFNERDLILYFRKIEQWHGYIRFLGMPHWKDEPDVPIDRLFVEPKLSKEYIQPDQDEENWPKTSDFLTAVEKNRRLVILGDPGSGKSTLVSWVSWMFSRVQDSLWTQRLGRLIPIPLIVRELRISAATTWESLLDEFLKHDMAAPLGTRSRIENLMRRGQVLLLIDGIDEVSQMAARRALRRALIDGAKRFTHSRILMTSRIVGYDQVPFDAWHHSTARTSELGENESRDLPLSTTLAPLFTEASLSSLFGNRYERESSRHRMIAPFAGNIGKTSLARAILAELLESSMAARFYVCPFSREQIIDYARNWYLVRDPAHQRGAGSATDLIQSISKHRDVLKLARIPNLLTFMALIHRNRASLPNGRAKLYGQIVEAYLQSIDEFRKLQEVPYRWEEKRLWLSYVGFQMQVRRHRASRGRAEAADHDPAVDTEAGHAGNVSEVLVSIDDLTEWVREAMRRDRPDTTIEEATRFVDYVARRSGLLLPRGEGQFAFVHLSFQEFFAAHYLSEWIATRDWQRESLRYEVSENALPLPVRASALKDYSGSIAWRETLFLLFETLSEKLQGAVDLHEVVFAQYIEMTSDLSSADDSRIKDVGDLLASDWQRNRLDLLASLGVNPQIKPRELRSRILKFLWLVNCGISYIRAGWYDWAHGGGFWRQLVTAEEEHDLVWSACADAVNSSGSTARLTLAGSTISDLSPIREFTNLTSLDLAGCQRVVDLSPIEGLKELSTLSLSRCTSVESLRPLTGLKRLEDLDLMYTGSSADLTALKSLPRLRSLHVSGVDSLELIGGLYKVDSLGIWGSTFTDLSPISNLRELRYLHLLKNERVSDFSPIGSLTLLRHLTLWGSPGLVDAPFLARLSNLVSLDLDDCHSLHDISALVPLPNLATISLRGCTKLRTLEPLTKLPVLTRVYPPEHLVDEAKRLGLPIRTH